MTARTHATQYIYGSMHTAADSYTDYLGTVQDESGVEFEHGDVFLTAQETVYTALRQSRYARQRPASTDVKDVLSPIEDALAALDEVKAALDEESLSVSRFEREVERDLIAAFERAAGYCHVHTDLPVSEIHAFEDANEHALSDAESNELGTDE